MNRTWAKVEIKSRNFVTPLRGYIKISTDRDRDERENDRLAEAE